MVRNRGREVRGGAAGLALQQELTASGRVRGGQACVFSWTRWVQVPCLLLALQGSVPAASPPERQRREGASTNSVNTPQGVPGNVRPAVLAQSNHQWVLSLLRCHGAHFLDTSE